MLKGEREAERGRGGGNFLDSKAECGKANTAEAKQTRHLQSQQD